MDMAINALKLGIDEFILKPFTPKELSTAVSKALEKERLRKENVRLRSLIPLFELNRTLMGTVEVENVLNRLIEIAQKETKASFAGLYTIEGNETTSIFHCDGTCTEVQRDACDKLAKLALEDGNPLTSSLSEADETHRAIMEQLEAISVAATPLKSQKGNLGVLILAHRENYFAPSDSEFLSVLCGQASIALINARLFAEIQEAYQKLQTLDHMKSEFINIAAHELRTPLAILMGYATILQDETTDLQQEYVFNILRNAMRLRALIDDMLNLQYLESGIASLAQDSLNLQEVVQVITQDVSLLAEEKDLGIHIDIPPDFPQMIIDRQKFDLILVNLIQNAIKFTPAGGQIIFRAKVTDNQTTMFVNNKGIRIPEEKLERIFDRFYQVEDTLTRQHGGAGLGLAIVRGMVEVCGGTISVESTDIPDTTFTIVLPLDNRHVEARKLRL
jgi:signal transduction histidine kinase